MSRQNTSPFLAAAHGQNRGRVPTWFMRQAGRYLPEYQGLRKQYDFRAMSHTPKLIHEVTLQPLLRYDLDAAILFSDILTCLEFMGAPFRFGEEGPTLQGAGVEVLDRLTQLDPAKHMSFVGEGIQLITQDLQKNHPGKPLIGFVGAPFTLLSYLIEGGTSREFNKTRRALLEQPEKVEKALDTLTDSIAAYLVYQAECGVKAVQIFDSWVGFLSAETYEKLLLPRLERVVQHVQKNAGIPVIAYAQPTSHLLPLISRSGANVISVDWRSKLSVVARHLEGPAAHVAVQGNLDPLVTAMPWNQAKPHVERLCEDALQAGLRHKWIFNVGHGVTPDTRTETLGEIIRYVHGI